MGSELSRPPPPGLHLYEVIQRGYWSNVVREVLTSSPCSAAVLSPQGRSALLCACEGGYSNAFVQELLKVYPPAASMRAADGCLPLHAALAADYSNTTMMALIAGYPQAATMQSPTCSWPFHVALDRRFSNEVAERLFALSPECAGITSADGNLPLHTALKGGYSNQFVLQVAKAYPEAVGTKSPMSLGGWLPLHLALSGSYSNHVVSELAAAYPAGAQALSPRGESPLLLALADPWGYSNKVATQLLGLWPQAATHPSPTGHLPLHYAVNRGFSRTVILELMKAHPDGGGNDVARSALTELDATSSAERVKEMKQACRDVERILGEARLLRIDQSTVLRAQRRLVEVRGTILQLEQSARPPRGGTAGGGRRDAERTAPAEAAPADQGGRYGSPGTGGTCPVCFEGLQSGAMALPCGHVLHSACCESLRAYSRRCPLCRGAF